MLRSHPPRLAARRRVAASSTAVSLVLALGLSACGGTTKPAPSSQIKADSGKVGDTLTIATSFAPPTMNPGTGDPAYSLFYQFAYDPLVVLNPDGTYGPGLATKWGYTGTGNTTYELTLRPGVTFSDGTPLTADAVKQWLEYEKAGGHSPAQTLAAVTAIEVTGPLALRLTLSTPDPGLTFGFAQAFGAGYIASPKALASPTSLNTGTNGAGPYTLDPAETVASDHYTYVPSPGYWNKPAVRWKKVVVKVIANPNSVLQALRAGQVQAAIGDSSTMVSAKSAGLDVVSTQQALTGLNLVDRAGALSKPLGDPRVRRALNLAVARVTIAKALYGDPGLALTQFALPGQPGFDEALDPSTSYDPAKAKQLLTDAGYAGGFTLPVLDASLLGQDKLVQAMAGYYAKVGVTLQVTTKATANDYLQGMVSGQYPAVSIGYGLSTMQSLYVGYVNPQGPFNPLHTSDPALNALYAAYYSAPEADSAATQNKINNYLVEQGWAVPVVGAPYSVYQTASVTGLQLTGGNGGVPMFTTLRPV